MDLECHHNTYIYGNAAFGEGQWTSPYICTNNDGYENPITINRCCSYEMVTVTIHHYNQYSWWTFNVTITPILLVMPPLVTFSFWWQRLWSVTIAHMQWWRSLSVIINHYWWRTLNVTTTHILLAMPPLVTEVMVHHHCSYEMVTIVIHHYKSLLVMDFICHYNTYTFGDIQFLLTNALLTVTNELMVIFFAPHQCPFLL